MKTIRLLSYIRRTQPGLAVWEEKQILKRVRSCSEVVKDKIRNLVNGDADTQFGYTVEGADGRKVTLTVGMLVNDFELPVLQAFLFLDWMGKDPSGAVGFLRSHDFVRPLPENSLEEEDHDDADLEQEI